jgi:hypothetical protein
MSLLGSAAFDLLLPWSEGSVDADALKAKRKKATDEAKTRVAGANIKTLKKVLEDIDDLLSSDDERRSGVETRLTTMLGLTSIAAAMVTGIPVALASGTLRIEGLTRWSVIAVLLYLVLQLCDAVVWAIRGLERRTYWSLDADDVLPKVGMTDEERLRERIVEGVGMHFDNREKTNEKVTAMAVAHRAATNFIVCVFLLAIGLLALPLPVAQNATVEALKTDSALRAMLQGPVGPPGPAGPAGPVGPSGAPQQCPRACPRSTTESNRANAAKPTKGAAKKGQVR